VLPTLLARREINLQCLLKELYGFAASPLSNEQVGQSAETLGNQLVVLVEKLAPQSERFSISLFRLPLQALMACRTERSGQIERSRHVSR
jgi:hypothetical protein